MEHWRAPVEVTNAVAGLFNPATYIGNEYRRSFLAYDKVGDRAKVQAPAYRRPETISYSAGELAAAFHHP